MSEKIKFRKKQQHFEKKNTFRKKLHFENWRPLGASLASLAAASISRAEWPLIQFISDLS